MRYWSKVIAITWKDMLSELRTRETIPSVVVFAILVIVIFNFAFDPNQETLGLVAAGILWVTFTFAGVLSLNRAFIVEKEDGRIEGLMICPVGREAIYIGKMLGSLLFMLFIEAIALPVFALFFNLAVFSPQLITIVVLTTVGFVALGTLFSALAVNTRAREMVLPIIFLPVVVPIIISAVEASRLALAGAAWNKLGSWLGIIVAFDIIFVILALWVFSFVVEE